MEPMEHVYLCLHGKIPNPFAETFSLFVHFLADLRRPGGKLLVYPSVDTNISYRDDR